MSAQFQENPHAVEWREAPPEHPSALRQGTASELLRWLTYRGLLTVQLRRACGGGFRLQLLEERDGPGLMVEEQRLRRVILWCGDSPCVYAESHLPRETLERLPSLQSLGNDPLGEALQSQPGVYRGPFEFALLRTPALPVPLEHLAEEALCARRSTFTVGDSGLVVAEAFLPGILEVGPPPEKE